jgi:hypothetical protein
MVDDDADGSVEDELETLLDSDEVFDRETVVEPDGEFEEELLVETDDKLEVDTETVVEPEGEFEEELLIETDDEVELLGEVEGVAEGGEFGSKANVKFAWLIVSNPPRSTTRYLRVTV